MQFVTGCLGRLFLSMKTKPGIFWFALSVALILAVWRFWDFYREASQTYLQISMKSSIEGTAQLYYDVGSGLSEVDSVSVSVIGDRNYHDYRFRLPGLPIFGMRFDPLTSEGSVAIRQIRWMDGKGAIIQSINPAQLQPLNQIDRFNVSGQMVEAVINQKASDPQIGVQLTRPLKIGKGYLLWRHPAVTLMILFEFVAVFAVVTILLTGWFTWRKNVISLYHRGKIPGAMLLALIAVITLETMQQAKLPAKASYHEVDELLHQLQTQQIHADYMLLGDSVGRQLFKNTPYLQNEKYAMLATNQAITMTGQYFIAKRYLQRNKMPNAVILLTSRYFHGNLDQSLSDNYIQRTFTNFAEISEILALKKDPVFTAKMLAYRFSPSFKFRLSLQKQWVGFTNAESISGIAYDNRDRAATRYSLLKLISSRTEQEHIPLHHFKSLLAFLGDRNVPLFFMTPAVNEESMDIFIEYKRLCSGLFPELQRAYPDFHFDNDVLTLPAKYYVDGSHFNGAGLKIETQRLHEKIIGIEKIVNSRASE